MNARGLLLAVGAMLSIAACGVSTVQPTVSIDDKGCASSDTDEWPNGVLDIEVSNSSASTSAVVMGTYDDGLGREDLVAYGSDISTRPPFITALEILEVAPARTRTLVFDHDPGTYFMTCLPDQNTMIVLDDVIIED